MAVILCAVADEEKILFINFWHWRAIVEVVRRLGIIPEDRVQALHDQYCGNGLTKEEAAKVATAIRAQLLSTLSDKERVLLDGSRTTDPDDGAMHYEDPAKNYGTNAAVLQKFVEFCELCDGFEVN